jgi:HEAT repeat protein
MVFSKSRSRPLLAAVAFAVTLIPRGVFCADSQLPALVRALQSRDRDENLEALEKLEALGLDAISAEPYVERLLVGRDKRLQAGAARVLAGLKADAAPAIPKLIALLATRDTPWIMTDVGGIPYPGSEAALALAAIGTDAVGPLIRSLEDRNRVVRFQAAVALGEMGPAAKDAGPALLKRLNDPAAAVRLQVSWSLLRVVPGEKKAIDAVVARLKDKDKDVRATTADALKDVRPVPKIVIDGLIEALDDKEGLVQAHAARTLGKYGSEAVPAVPALTRMLRDRNAYPYPDGHPYPGLSRPVAEMAARALGQIGAPAKPALPALLDTIRDRSATFEDIGIARSNEIARAEAAEAAARIDPGNDELVRVLNESLTADASIREGVAWALAIVGTRATPAHTRLVELLRSEDSGKLPLACAVLSIDPQDSGAFETLLKELRAGHPVGEQHWPVLAAILERCDPQGKRAIPALAKYLPGDHSNEDTICATRTLARYGPKASAALDDLMKLLDDAFAEVRCEAVAAMWRIAPARQEFFGAAIKKADPQARLRIMEGLKSLPGSTPMAVEALNDPSASVRFAALAAIEPSRVDDRAIQSVRNLSQDQSRSIREAADRVLRRVDRR